MHLPTSLYSNFTITAETLHSVSHCHGHSTYFTGCYFSISDNPNVFHISENMTLSCRRSEIVILCSLSIIQSGLNTLFQFLNLELKFRFPILQSTVTYGSSVLVLLKVRPTASSIHKTMRFNRNDKSWIRLCGSFFPRYFSGPYAIDVCFPKWGFLKRFPLLLR